jgi:hypothetical protein
VPAKKTWIIVLTSLVLVASAAPAAAQTWRPTVRQCVAGSATAGCATVPGLGGAWNVVLSPDGRTAYTAGLSAGVIRIFDRNTTTGALTLKPGAAGCITWTLTNGCTQARAIRRPDEILISADGRSLYVTSNFHAVLGVAAAVAVFKRNPDGTIAQLPGKDGCINDDGSEGCFDGNSIGGQGAILSGDQRNLYVLGVDTVAILQRSTADGKLTQAPPGCIGNPMDGCTLLDPRPSGRQLALSSDGTRLYVPASSGILVFSRNAGAGGALAKIGCSTQTQVAGCARVPQIGPLANNVVLSPNNRNVYLSHRDGIVTFTRGNNGLVAFRSCINDNGSGGCANSSNVSNLTYMAASPDGQDILAVPQGSPGGFTAFARNAGNGDLTRRGGLDGCITPDGSGFNNGAGVANACRADARMNFFGHIHFGGDGEILVGQFGGDRVLLLKRDFYPTCSSRTLQVRRNTARKIALRCSDRNGDPFTRSIVEAPKAGRLGAIDQAAGTVFYDPFSRFSGGDQFTFRASGPGMVGPSAAITITVPGPKAKKIRGVALAFTYASFSDRTVLGRLILKGVPKGATVRATCKLGKHRCAGKAGKAFVKKRAKRTVNLSKRFANVDLKVGSKITVKVTKRGRIGIKKVLTIRARKAPKITSR